MGTCASRRFDLQWANLESIQKYEALWASAFDDDSVRWMSKTTKNRKGILEGFQTFNDKAFYNGAVQVPRPPPPPLEEPVIVKLPTREEAVVYFQTTLRPIFGGRGPSAYRVQNDEGFYTMQHQGNRKVMSCADVFNVRRRYTRPRRDCQRRSSLVPCYRDLADNTTLEWWVIHVRL